MCPLPKEDFLVTSLPLEWLCCHNTVPHIQPQISTPVVIHLSSVLRDVQAGCGSATWWEWASLSGVLCLSGCCYFKVELPALPVLKALMRHGRSLKSIGSFRAPYSGSSGTAPCSTLSAHHQSKVQAETKWVGWKVDAAFLGNLAKLLGRGSGYVSLLGGGRV